jgi:hypothetical protein
MRIHQSPYYPGEYDEPVSHERISKCQVDGSREDGAEKKMIVDNRYREKKGQKGLD